MTERARIKPGKASLIGGIAVGIAVLVLWTAIAHEFSAISATSIGAGFVVAAAIASWIRLADL